MRITIVLCVACFLGAAYPEFDAGWFVSAFIGIYAGAYDLLEFLKQKKRK